MARQAHFIPLAYGFLSFAIACVASLDSTARADDGMMRDRPADMAGIWRIDGSATGDCRIFLSDVGTRDDAFRLSVTDACARAHPLMSGLASWRPGPGGGIVMMDAANRAVVEWGISELEGLESLEPRDLFAILVRDVQADSIATASVSQHDDQ